MFCKSVFIMKNCKKNFFNATHILFVVSLCSLSLGACSAVEIPSKDLEQRASDSTLHALEKKFGIISDPKLEKFFDRVTRRLSDSIETLRQYSHENPLNNEFIPYSWNIHILNDSTINAFALGAGHIVVTRMLFEQSPSEAAFVSVIAHEMSHELLGHTKEALTLALNESNQTNTHYSLAQELVADELGLELLSLARYNTQHSLDALTLGYRTTSGTVAAAPPDWLTVRSARLHSLILSNFMLSPATENTREFSGLQRTLKRTHPR